MRFARALHDDLRIWDFGLIVWPLAGQYSGHAVAVKQLYSTKISQCDDASLTGFAEEAAMLLQLNHPGEC